MIETKYWTDFNVDTSGLPLRISTAGSQRREPFTRKPRGFEPDFLLHLTLSGEGTLEKGGLLYTLSPGAVLLIRPGFPLFYAPSVAPWSAIWITFRGILADKLLTQESGIYRTKSDFLFSILKKIRDLPEAERAERASVLLYRLLLSLDKHILPYSVPHSGDESTGVHAARNYIHLHYSEPLTVDDLARVANLSRRTLERKFRTAFSNSPLDYLNRYRMAEAIEYLKYFPDMPIREIARKVGFSSVTHYNYLCRRYGQTSPSFTRMQFRNYAVGYRKKEQEESDEEKQ